jgi:hypothetical protein
MANKNEMAYRTSVKVLLDEHGVSKPIQIMRVGKWNHPVYGLIDITIDKLKQFVDNFKANVRGLVDADDGKPRVDIDYDHKKRRDDASGWIKDLKLSDDGRELWAMPKWTTDAGNAIRSGAYGYFSPEFVDRYKDVESGRTFTNVLLGGALTNRPFIKGMSAVSLSESGEPNGDGNTYLLMDDDGANEQEKNQRKEGTRKMDIEKKLVETEAKHEATVKALDEAKAVNVETKKKLDEAEAKVKAFETEKANAEAKAKADAITSLCEGAVKEGKVQPADAKEGGFLYVLAEKDIKSAEVVISKLPKVINDEGKGSNGEGMDDDKTKGKKILSESEFDAKATELSEKGKVSYADAVKKLEADGFMYNHVDNK